MALEYISRKGACEILGVTQRMIRYYVQNCGLRVDATVADTGQRLFKRATVVAFARKKELDNKRGQKPAVTDGT